ncbi:restriction endonuclease subunit S [Parapedobacter tibetensis]|uniref:restriction endonuclease subunit S n=1 Tax=Parapedobacter tibetensis TaxID=2972951 RepID=UPI00214D1AF1|nr:restriction endonuclease subunit S [Parapedobacter tibetensis]
MSIWKTYKLMDLINVKHGFAFKGEFFSDEPTTDILLTPGNFKIGGGFKTDKLKYYNGEVPEDYVLNEGDILITMTDLSKAGDTLGYSAKIPQHKGIRYLHNQRLGLVQLKNEEVDSDFLHWVLRTRPYQYFIVSSATGSTVKHTSPIRICGYEFEAPVDKTEQQSIAQILTSLDDKIELNLQMNQTLEAMAQAIFKEWFVNFNFPGFDGQLVDGLPKGWEAKNIGELGTVVTGSTPSSKNPELFGEITPFITPTDFKNYGKLILDANRCLSVEGKESMTSRLLPPNSVLVTCIGSDMGKVAINRVESVSNQQINSIIPNINQVTSDYLYYDLVFKYDYLRNIATGGSTMPIINKSRFQEIQVIIPSEDLRNNFQELMENFNSRIEENVKQIKSLTQTRDTLLPKLMSGKLELTNN